MSAWSYPLPEGTVQPSRQKEYMTANTTVAMMRSRSFFAIRFKGLCPFGILGFSFVLPCSSPGKGQTTPLPVYIFTIDQNTAEFKLMKKLPAGIVSCSHDAPAAMDTAAKNPCDAPAESRAAASESMVIPVV